MVMNPTRAAKTKADMLTLPDQMNPPLIITRTQVRVLELT